MGNALMCFPVKDLEFKGGFRSRSQNSQASSKAITVNDSSSINQERSESISDRNQTPNLQENIETTKIVLVHGEGFGAWCWYKIVSSLEESGMDPIALDLSGSGIDREDPNTITTLEHYAKPLMGYMKNLPEDEKVILVGHSCGGAIVSYALESYPEKISKAVFLSATMVSDGQRPFDIFAKDLQSTENSMKESQNLLYSNGTDNPPTGLTFDTQQMKVLFFNRSPLKDISLAAACMRPIPLQPMMERLNLTNENYGSARRFFIHTLEDHVLCTDIQEEMARENPPERVFKIKGSDHCPFFSKPRSLHKILLEIARLL